MKPHEERVVVDKRELDDKLEKLTKFIGGEIFPLLTLEEQTRLSQQRDAMTVYSNILGERIAAFYGMPDQEHMSGIVGLKVVSAFDEDHTITLTFTEGKRMIITCPDRDYMEVEII